MVDCGQATGSDVPGGIGDVGNGKGPGLDYLIGDLVEAVHQPQVGGLALPVVGFGHTLDASLLLQLFDPPEVVAHLPILCDERKTLYVFVPTKKKIGEAVGIDVPAASVSIVEEGDAANLIKEIGKRIDAIRRGK